MVFSITIVVSASCLLGMIIGSKYPETVSAGCTEFNVIANKTWSTVRETTSGIYAKMKAEAEKKMQKDASE